MLGKHAVMAGLIGRLFVMKLVIDGDPSARNYMDQALTPVDDEGDATLDLLTRRPVRPPRSRTSRRSPRSRVPAGPEAACG
jgi:hypothetical protein